MKLNLLFSLFFLGTMVAKSQISSHNGAPKYVPDNGAKLLILGQDLGAVGGLDLYTDGYVDNLNQVPIGVTTYTGIPGLGGLASLANWGSGDVNGQAYLNDDTFDNVCISIGLYINGQLKNITSGVRDNDLSGLANWIKEAGRPVFLRIGYEFDGSWNGLDPEDYREAWIYIVKFFDEQDVRNVAYVWQSAGINTSNIERWYPGDEYVNWVGYSHFEGSNPGQSIRDFAEEHNKPVMIAEATPRVDLKTGSGEAHWENWYAPLFETIYGNDRIKALAYINVNWDAQPMWQGLGWGDSRVQVNEYIKEEWLNETQQDLWLKSTDTSFEILQYQLWQDSLVEVTSGVLSLEHHWEWSITRDNIDWVVTNTSELEFKLKAYGLDGQLLANDNTRNGQIRLNITDINTRTFILSLETAKAVTRRKIQLID